ncbi:enoyl-CoA hydratase/isomerase family protein, partial [Streptomyces sp. NPDC002785]|uniref:enoyl-CoA hydratase/isomerase family protein n=1 Tax=Streptomyces sp. NPDC002785 TaxID=3154543 RepID=UPI003323B4F7
MAENSTVVVTRHPMTATAADVYVAEVTLNRPDKLNAWTGGMRSQLVAALDSLGADERCRAVVLTGAGRAFCAGQDLAETAAIDPDDHAAAEAWIDDFGRLFRAVRSLDKPVVAAVNGVAAGSGFQFALLADFRIGHATVRMGQPEVLSGIPSITGIWAMRGILGRAKTTEFALGGRLVDGAEAERLLPDGAGAGVRAGGALLLPGDAAPAADAHHRARKVAPYRRAVAAVPGAPERP